MMLGALRLIALIVAYCAVARSFSLTRIGNSRLSSRNDLTVPSPAIFNRNSKILNVRTTQARFEGFCFRADTSLLLQQHTYDRSSSVSKLNALTGATESSQQNPFLKFISSLLSALKSFFCKLFNIVKPAPAKPSTAAVTPAPKKRKTSEIFNLQSSPLKKLLDRDAQAKKYVEAKLREIDSEYLKSNNLRVSKRDRGRWPPNLEVQPKPFTKSVAEALATAIPTFPQLNSKSVASKSAAMVSSVSAATAAVVNSAAIAAVSRKRSVSDLSAAELKGKSVLVRCDLNVPIKDGVITDDTRIRGSIPTIKYLMEKGAKVLLSSHLGRPAGTGFEEKFSLLPVTSRLSELLGQTVPLVPDCIGMAVPAALHKMSDGDVALLENVRFYKEEEQNNADFAKQLAAHADVFVNDAFGTAHRAHASTEGVTAYLKPAVAGFLLQKELDYLQGAVQSPKRPFAAIVGGSKVSSKISVIEAMLDKVDVLVLGGGMVFTFLKARGLDVGSSLVELDQLELATKLESIAAAKGVKLVLASDVVVADKFAADAATQTVDVAAIPAGWMGLDIGPKSIAEVQSALAECNTVIWNGPMGVFEFDAFAKGTNAVATTLAELTGRGCITIIGGGDSVAAVEKAGLAEKMSHISTGGGASLELLEGKVLPGIAALNDAK